MPQVVRAGEAPRVRKARGAFFTPPDLCRYMAGWAIRNPNDRVLEPSCGEAAFLHAAAERLATLGARNTRHQLHGVELHAPSASAARARLGRDGLDADIRVGNFFDIEPAHDFDAVIGNPPYVRYQDFSGLDRARARAAASAAGVRLTALASSWAAFTVHATLSLRPDGRLALVLPAELLSTNYAGEIRAFLMRRFARLRLVVFTERVFPEVLEEVVLLLAEGQGPTDHCDLHQFTNADDLGRGARRISRWHPTEPAGKWTPALLTADALTVYERVARSTGFAPLRRWGEVTLGAVTGNNRYFALTETEARGLSPKDLLRISPPGSRHLRGLTFGGDSWDAMRRAGGRVWLFRPAGEPSRTARARIDAGESLGVHRAYKCRVRDPWWRTPVPPPPDLFVTYMNADTPRVVANEAGVHHLNSVHGLYVAEGRRDAARRLPIASLNSLTLLGAETVGRAYGGGMLKLEPREADVLPVPDAELVEALRSELDGARERVSAALAKGELSVAVALVDRIVLSRALGMPEGDLRLLREARRELAGRRRARGRAMSER